MFAVIMAVVGVVLIYNPLWFAGASVVGWVLIAISGLVFALIVMALILAGASTTRRF